jgi:hypothetical protein
LSIILLYVLAVGALLFKQLPQKFPPALPFSKKMFGDPVGQEMDYAWKWQGKVYASIGMVVK